MSIDQRRQHVAIHEAGHAVITRVFNVACGDCRIGAETWPDGHVSEGCSGFASLETIRMDRHYQGLPPSNKGTMFDFCRATMAGREAEVLILGEHVDGGDGGDSEFIEWLMTHPDAIAMGADSLEAQLREETHNLCREHIGRIQAVADELLERGRLSDTDIRAMPIFRVRPTTAG
jgi:hypothetical protein